MKGLHDIEKVYEQIENLHTQTAKYLFPGMAEIKSQEKSENGEREKVAVYTVKTPLSPKKA